MPNTAINGWPGPNPTVANGAITVDLYMQNPARVSRGIDLATRNQFFSDVIFGSGPPTSGGAVIFDKVLANYAYSPDRKAEEIAPASEFPVLTAEAPQPSVGIVRKFGGAVFITDENRDRNDQRNLRIQQTVLTNELIRKNELNTLSTLEAAITAGEALTLTGGNWGAADPGIWGQLQAAKALSKSTSKDLYTPDTVLLHGDRLLDIQNDDTLWDKLSEASREANIRNATIGQILGLTFIVSNEMDPNFIYVLQRGIVGGVSTEKPLTTEVIPERKKQITWIQSDYRRVPYVDQPLALVKLTGVNP